MLGIPSFLALGVLVHKSKEEADLNCRSHLRGRAGSEVWNLYKNTELADMHVIIDCQKENTSSTKIDSITK
ncbi:hypothetical protein TNCV_2954161, partial [Trichonephila clavipes]